MTDREEFEIAVKALDSKKAKDIKVLKIDELTILANYFVIASATSTTQVKALADEVEFQLGERGVQAKSIEGYQSKSWIVLDYVDVIVHIFLESEREFFDRLKGLTDVLLDNEDIFAYCYTQLTDVEQEQNGLLTYDRRFKFPPEKVHPIFSRKAKIEE